MDKQHHEVTHSLVEYLDQPYHEVTHCLVEYLDRPYHEVTHSKANGWSLKGQRPKWNVVLVV